MKKFVEAQFLTTQNKTMPTSEIMTPEYKPSEQMPKAVYGISWQKKHKDP